MRCVAIIEARMGSTRLPGKSLKKILGKPMLELLIDRVRKAKLIDELVVATSENKKDNAITTLAKKLGVGCFRGSETDVLDRVLNAAKTHEADHIVELWGDCPLIDPDIIDDLIRYYLNNEFDLVGTCLDETFPWGISALVFPTKILEEVSNITQDPVDRENVSNYIYEHPERYKIGHLPCPPELKHPEIRLTVDELADFELVETIFEFLTLTNPEFRTIDVINFLEANPKIKNINRQVKQKKLRK
ncbi:MAG: spore coat biosynthesis protein F [Epsilonproteobacteria bacterium]|nr:MAG: spore coat biosynthesis protein F [Campylobacterota bacterium]